MRNLTVILAIFLTTFSAIAQQLDLRYYIPDNERYNNNIPTPKEVIGHEVGEWHVTHDNLVAYMRALAKASDRISIEDRGKTYEGRPLLLLTITTPENHSRLDQIRERHLKATNDASIDVSKDPIVVYQGFSIHGNEPSGSNAALAAAYYLAASTTSDTKDLLRNTIILFDPSLNPDGLQRFAYWANTNKSKLINPDPNDREYTEVWPRGRTNHYWFDMNRDWLPVQLPESKARIETFHQWLPNILTDHHEMGSNSTFFFQPGIQSRTHPLTPAMNQELTKEIATYHAKALDRIGSQYYSEESFDDFYYGKGSTFQDINGGIGILFEQEVLRGMPKRLATDCLPFLSPFEINIQQPCHLGCGKSMRAKILAYQQDFLPTREQRASKAKAIVFGDAKDAAKAYHLAEVLQRHKVRIHELKSDFTSNGKVFKKGYSYLIPMNQKNQRLVKAMFDRRTTFQDSLFYDVSAWSFNHSFGVDYLEDVPLNKAGDEIKELKPMQGTVSFKSDIGYLMPWNEYYAPKALNAVLQKGLRAKVSMKNFSNGGISYDYGTIFIPVQNQKFNAAELYDFLVTVSKDAHLKIYGVNTGLNDGIDLGS